MAPSLGRGQTDPRSGDAHGDALAVEDMLCLPLRPFPRPPAYVPEHLLTALSFLMGI